MPKASQRSKHCMYRLLNVLFSDMFYERFQETGKQYKREQLDCSAVGKADGFWADVSIAFSEEGNEAYDNLLFVEDEFEGIDCSHIIAHDGPKLQSMWKEVNSRYCRARNNFQLSGTHDSHFQNFCMQRMEVYYLRLCLNMRPGNISLFLLLP